MCQIAERHLGASGDKRFSFGDGGALRALLCEAGFADVRVETVVIAEQHREFPIRLNVMAMNFDLSALSEAERERRLTAVEAESGPVLARFAAIGGFAESASANLATATAPKES